MDIGIHRGVYSADYHKRELGIVSKSALDQLAKSPAHYRYWVDHGGDDPTPAMEFGTALHCAVLEPERFANEYVVAPTLDRRTKAGKESYEDFTAANAGKITIGHPDLVRVESMRDALRDSPTIGPILASDGDSELTVVWVDSSTGLKCKARVDRYSSEYGLAVDIKTTQSTTPQAFARSCADFGYHYQAALYSDGLASVGLPIRKFVFAAVESQRPHACAPYWCSEASLTRARERNARLMRLMCECLDSDRWPECAGGELDVPAWKD